MARLAEIDADLTELPDYEKGIRLERERIVKLLETEKARSKLGFIQYQRILELMEINE
jgi:hypothetical protein